MVNLIHIPTNIGMLIVTILSLSLIRFRHVSPRSNGSGLGGAHLPNHRVWLLAGASQVGVTKLIISLIEARFESRVIVRALNRVSRSSVQ